MKRSGTVKFPNSVQLFKFCQKVLSHQKNGKIRDQELGNILNFNPSDCSHWKRGEKNVRSVFALANLAETLQVDISLIHDIASGAINLDEAYYEYLESRAYKQHFTQVNNADLTDVRQKINAFVSAIHEQCDFVTPPLYLPEVTRYFSFISTQTVEMVDKLSRILRVRPGQYTIQYRKGDLKPQTRMSIVNDLARIIFEGERQRFPELGPLNKNTVHIEEMLFTANILAPKHMLIDEMSKLDARHNVIAELSALFWAPKCVIGLQLQDIVRSNILTAVKDQTEELTDDKNTEENQTTTNNYENM